MGQVHSLDFQVSEHCQDFCDWHLFADFEDIKETRNILLDVQLDSQRLVSHVLDTPEISDLTVSLLLKLSNVLQVVVYVAHIVVKDLLGRVLYTNKKVHVLENSTITYWLES